MKVAGVDYDVDWRKFTKGKSLFFPCLDQKAVLRDLRPKLKRMKLDVVHKYVVDPKSGIRGLRIWRT